MNRPVLTNSYGVTTPCPDCNGAVTYYDFRDAAHEYGTVTLESRHEYEGQPFGRVVFKLLRCSRCGRGGVAKIHDQVSAPKLESFYPRAVNTATLPSGVPDGVLKEYREAELCASVEAWRAASALLRSALEKTLKANGYQKGTLQQRIDEAAADGVITAARKQKAHDDVRVLGNEVVHDDWRAVTEDEVQSALHYVQRILEDLYDDRSSVETILYAKNRLQKPPSR